MATTHYDSDDGDDATGDGSVGNPFKLMAKFTSVDARSAGDKGICRNNRVAQYDSGDVDLAFDEDGDFEDPIILTRDYINAFGDDVDLSATELATFTFGSKVVTYAGDISGVLAAGDWIYADGDDPEEFCYEVDSVVTVTVTLFLPYKGDQAGSGRTTTNIGSPPIWGGIAVSRNMLISSDNYWKFQGLHCRSTSTAGAFRINATRALFWQQCIFEGDGVSNSGLKWTTGGSLNILRQCRFFNYSNGIQLTQGGAGPTVFGYDCLFDGNNAAGSIGLAVEPITQFYFVDTEFKGHATADIKAASGVGGIGQRAYFRNCILASVTETDSTSAYAGLTGFYLEDYDGVPGETEQHTGFSTNGPNSADPTLVSDTGVVRPGGGAVSLLVTPSTRMGTAWEHSRFQLFEYGVNATTESKQYDIYFRPTATADWTADPVAGELWIEFEFWGHASNNYRRIVKSTGVIDMNGSDTWQVLSVTVAPAQAGRGILRCFYAKTKEGGKANTFRCDPLPVVT